MTKEKLRRLLELGVTLTSGRSIPPDQLEYGALWAEFEAWEPETIPVGVTGNTAGTGPAEPRFETSDGSN